MPSLPPADRYKPGRFQQLIVWFVAIGGLAILLLLVYLLWKRTCGEYAYPVGPQPDEYLPTKQAAKSGVDLGTTTRNDFPNFLGPNYSLAADHAKLDPNWKDHPPKLLWKQPIGAGWSAFSIVNGFAVTMEQRGPDEQVACYSLRTGEHHWTTSWKSRFSVVGAGPRSTPTINNGRVYALGAWGHLVCLQGNTGRVIWEREVLTDLGIDWKTENRDVRFGRCASPLVTNSMVIIPGGGDETKYSLLAYDAETGKPIWRGGDRQISYSSPIATTICGQKQILSVNEDNVTGHSIADGSVFWSYPWNGHSNEDASVSQPVPIGNSRIFLSKGYGRGAAVIQLSKDDKNGAFQLKTVWTNRSALRTKFTNVVIWQGCVYGLSEGKMECVDLTTGKSKWKHGYYGHGQILRVQDQLLILTEEGEVVLMQLNPKRGDIIHGRRQVLKGRTWNNVAMYGDLLLIRNATEAACLKLATMK